MDPAARPDAAAAGQTPAPPTALPRRRAEHVVRAFGSSLYLPQTSDLYVGKTRRPTLRLPYVHLLRRYTSWSSRARSGSRRRDRRAVGEPRRAQPRQDAEPGPQGGDAPARALFQPQAQALRPPARRARHRFPEPGLDDDARDPVRRDRDLWRHGDGAGLGTAPDRHGLGAQSHSDHRALPSRAGQRRQGRRLLGRPRAADQAAIAGAGRRRASVTLGARDSSRASFAGSIKIAPLEWRAPSFSIIASVEGPG